MLVLSLMLSMTHYAQNYADIIGGSLVGLWLNPNPNPYYAFKITQFALEQCSKILSIMLNLCSICKVLCSANLTFYFSYPT